MRHSCAGAGRRVDGPDSIVQIRLVVHAAGEGEQVVAFQPMDSGQQPVGVAVALALHEVDGHQQIELLKRLVEFGAVGSRHHGVSGVDHHRPDLTAPGCGYLRKATR